MKFEKLVKDLKLYLSKAEKKKRAQCDRIDELLEQLEEKKKKLERKLAEEKHPTKKKRLNTDLKIITLQLKKGNERRTELQGKCK